MEDIKSSEDIPGWGYRYKVRIIGIHDQGEGSLESEQLPWAQVMYPVTSGGGQGKSYQTPAIQQGMFVFGFFLMDRINKFLSLWEFLVQILKFQSQLSPE